MLCARVCTHVWTSGQSLKFKGCLLPFWTVRLVAESLIVVAGRLSSLYAMSRLDYSKWNHIEVKPGACAPSVMEFPSFLCVCM